MRHFFRIGRIVLLLTFCLASLNQVIAQSGHDHKPIVIDSRPIISKYPVSLVRPRRVISKDDGTLFVADWAAGTVIRITPKGESSIIAEELNEPAGLALDSTGQLYVCTFAQGMPKEGTVIRINSDGMKSVFAVGLSGPSALAFDLQDNLYVANFSDNSISTISSGGEVTTFVANIAGPSSLAFDESGALLVLSASEGSLYRISPMAEVTRVATGMSAPSDLVIHPGGHWVAVDFGNRRLVHISKKGRIRVFAVVPRGTVSAAFDILGNLIVANSDDHTLTKITSNLSLKCPHCEKSIPLRLRSQPKKRPRPPMSESKPMPPAI